MAGDENCLIEAEVGMNYQQSDKEWQHFTEQLFNENTTKLSECVDSQLMIKATLKNSIIIFHYYKYRNPNCFYTEMPCDVQKLKPALHM